MKALRVRDIMTSEVLTLSSDTRVVDAAQILTQRRVGGVPVLDAGRIVGVISKSDLVDPRSGLASGGARPIAEVMTHMVLTVRPDDAAMVAVSRMLDAGIHRVVVVDEGGKLAGILSPTDVMRALERGQPLHDEQAAPKGDAAKSSHVVDLRTFEVRI